MEVLKQSKIELWCKLLMRFENELKMYLRVGFQWGRQLKESRGSTNGNYFTLGEILFSDNHNNSIHFFWFPLRFEIYYKEEGGGRVWVLILPSILFFSKKLECHYQNQFEFSESLNIPQFHCWIFRTLWSMWDYQGCD